MNDQFAFAEPSPVPNPYRPARKRFPRWAIVVITLFVVIQAGVVVLIAGQVKFRGKAAIPQAEVEREREDDRREATAAFLDAQPPTAEESAEFVAYFNNLGKLLEDRQTSVVNNLFEFDRLFDELERIGTFEGEAGRGPRSQIRKGFLEGSPALAKALVNNPLFRWKSVKIQRIRHTSDGREVVVIVKHLDPLDDGSDLALKVRWWLIAAPEGWKIYDLEDIDGGMKISHAMRAAAEPQFLKNPEALMKMRDSLQQAVAAIKSQDFAALREAVKHLKPDSMPAPFAATMHFFQGLADASEEKWQDALDHYDRAEAYNADMPMIHYVRAPAQFALGRFQEALDSSRKYKSLLGGDSVCSMWEGAALERLGQIEESITAYKASLDENPNEIESLSGLLRTLPADRKPEAIARLAKVKDYRVSFDNLFAEAKSNYDQPALAVLIEDLRKRYPDDTTGLAEEVRIKVQAGKFDDAKAIVARGLALPKPEDARGVRIAYLYAMRQANRAREAYSAMPIEASSEAFRDLASNFEFDFDDDGPPTPETKKSLVELIAAHRQRRPNDAWLWYYEGILRIIEKEHAEALKLFTDGSAKLDASTPETEQASFRQRRVVCMYKVGQGLEALRTIGPPKETFPALANLYLSDKNLDGLKMLTDAYAKLEPGDPAVKYWRGEWHFARGEYAEAAAEYKRYRELMPDEKGFGWSADQNLLRSLLRAGRAAEAGMVLEKIGQDRIYAPVRIAVVAANNRVADVEKMLEDLTKPLGVDFLYHDQDFEREISRDAYSHIRKKYPPPNKQQTKPDT